MKSVGWAVIGTGHMADGMADAIRHADGAKLMTVVGRTREGASSFAERHGAASAHDDLTAALGTAVDAVYVGSPNALHAEHVRQALDAGKHVLCDKPLATDVSVAEALCARAARDGLLLSVNFQVRQHPGVALVRGWLRDGLLGRIVAVRASIAFGPEELVGWRSEPELASAAAVYNLGVHAIDTLLALIDDRVETAACVLRPPETALDRTAVATFTFAGGAVASVLVSQELSHDDVRIEILGTHGRIDWDGWMAPYRKGTLTLRAGDRPATKVDVECSDAYRRVAATFTRAILTGGVPVPSPDDVLRTVRVVEAALTAARQQRVVSP